MDPGYGREGFSLMGIILIVAVIVLLLGGCLFISTTFTQSDPVTPTGSCIKQDEIPREVQTQAKPQELIDETAHLQQMREGELENAQPAYEQELQASRESAALRSQLLRFGGYTLIVSGELCLLALSIGGAVYISRLRPARTTNQPPTRAETQSSTNVWTPERKRAEIRAARTHEREERKKSLRQKELVVEERFQQLFQRPAGPHGPKNQAELFQDLLTLTS